MKEPCISPALVVGPVLQHPRTDRVTVVWETQSEVIGEVTYGVGGGKRLRVCDPTPVSLHRNVLTGLTPGTAYDYSVAVGGETLFNGSFRTPPKRGPYRVVIFGDSHEPGGGFKGLLQGIADAKPDFIVILGDMVSRGRNLDGWRAFFTVGRDLFSRVPFTTAIGNHDVKHGTVLYDHYIGRPEGTPEGYYYSQFELGEDCFIVLDSRNDHLFFHQGFWLIGRLRELARRTDIRHIFVFSHTGPVSYKALRRGFIGLKPLLPLMGRAGVSAIFSGHDHHYLRGRLWFGFPCFVSGGACKKLYPASRHSPYAWLVGRKESEAVVNHFLVLDVADGRTTVRAVDGRGAIIDEVVLSPRRGYVKLGV